MNQELLRSFHHCLRYKQAHSLAKPLLDPCRFIRNQIRQKSRHPMGTIEKVDTFHTKNFTIVAGETVSEGLACYGIMEPELTEAFLHLVKPGQTTVDIGMHLGYFTTLFAGLVGPSGKVYAFEPTPSTREIAARNTERFSTVTVHPNAMWSHQETMTFHDYGLAHMAFNSVTAARLDHEVLSVREHQVEAISLDQFRRANSPRCAELAARRSTHLVT
jgi:FkbM family methyltransferase